MCNSIGLYIHIPFCKSKCPYCDFFSKRGCEEEYDNYCDILIKSIADWGRKVKKSVSTVYFGGGTPSVFGAGRLSKILTTVYDNFNLSNDNEITLEVNPDSGKVIDFAQLKSAGFNRLSIGLQSAVEKELKTLGRIHTTDDVKVTIERANLAGFSNISLDLMLGVPHQTLQSLERSIEFCNSCSVTHISSYILKIEENTYFHKIQSKLEVPDEDTQANIYLKSVEMLGGLGYEQYEISNFAKKGCESKHNINYWQCGEYLGIGPSAHSFLDGKRFYYGRSIDDFEKNIIIDDGLGGDEEEFIMLALRLKSGLQFEKFQNRFCKPLPSCVIDKAKKYEKYGYLTIDINKIALTSKGFLVSNAIISDLI